MFLVEDGPANCTGSATVKQGGDIVWWGVSEARTPKAGRNYPVRAGRISALRSIGASAISSEYLCSSVFISG
jgi:hypothetical protein